MAEPKMRKAYVKPEGGDEVEVEIPADHPAPDAVAVVAWRFKCNAWQDPRRVSVRLGDDGAKKKK